MSTPALAARANEATEGGQSWYGCCDVNSSIVALNLLDLVLGEQPDGALGLKVVGTLLGQLVRRELVLGPVLRLLASG